MKKIIKKIKLRTWIALGVIAILLPIAFAVFYNTEASSLPPTAHWAMDEGVDGTCANGEDVCDSSGSGFNLVNGGSSWRNEDFCISGKCLFFDESASLSYMWGDGSYPIVESTTPSNQATNSTSFVMSMPATRPDGDLYIAWFVKDDDDAFSSTPSNWTPVVNQASGTSVRMGLYYWIGDSEPSSYTVQGDSEQWSGAILRISGSRTSNPINQAATPTTGTDATADIPTVTPTVDNPLLLSFAGIDLDFWNTSDQYPSGWTGLFTQNSHGSTETDSANAIGASMNGTNGVSSGSGSFTANGSDEWLAVTLAIAPFGAGGSQTDVFTSTSTWDAPSGVTSVDVAAWGGGGSGGASCGSSCGNGSGGGGGAYSGTTGIAVTPGNTYDVVVGAGGTGVSNSNGNPGGDSYFIDNTTILAKGGSGGTQTQDDQVPTSGVQGGQASAGIGATKYSGGNSGLADNGWGSGGGGGAGDSANGGNSSNATSDNSNGGTGGSAGGGNGSAGIDSDSSSSTGGIIGGGSGGAGWSGDSSGDGARGEVRLTYILPEGNTTPISEYDSFSIGGWFRRPETDSASHIANQYLEAGFKIYMNSDGTISCGIDDDSSWGPDASVSSTESYDDNMWHQFQCVKNGTTSLTLYVDGQQVDQNSSISGVGSLENTAFMYIGVDSDGSSNQWQGFLDEIKIYDYARASEEVLADAVPGAGTSGSSAVFGQSISSLLTNGLVGYWIFDQTSGNLTDYSGNGLTLTNNNTVAFGAGKFGDGGEFIPASSEYFSTATTISGVQSVSFWVNPDSTTNYYLSLNGSAYITSSSGTLSATGFTSASIYVNGIQTNTIAQDQWQLVTVTTDTPIQADQFYVGRQSTNYFDGTIDEVRLYNRLLSPAEINALYGWAPGPVGYWNLDENTGSIAYDRSGNGTNSSAFTGDVSWSSGKYGSATRFDGTDDVIRIVESDPVDLGTVGSSYTISAWVRTTQDSAGFPCIVCKSAGSAPIPFYLLLSDTEVPMFGVEDSSDATEVFGSVAINDGDWHHLAGVRNGETDTVLLYVDGVLVDSDTDITSGSLANDADISFGNGGASYTDQDYMGDIDDVRIYNYARTSQQIVEDMNAGHPTGGSPVGTAISHWQFDECTSTTAYDRNTTSGNNLTLSSASWNPDGKFGCAWNGTGSVWASRADDSDFDFGAGQSFSLSIWARSDSASNPAANQFLIDKQIPTNNPGYTLYFNTSGQVVCAIDDDTSSFPEDSATSPNDYYDATWHHIVCSRDISGGSLNLYVDGQLVASDTSLSATGDLSNSDSLWIGDDDGDATNSFAGDIDEVKIFASALSSDQVKIVYSANSAVNFSSGYNENSDLTGGIGSLPVAHYTFDENTDNTCSGGTADVCDRSGNGFDLTKTNMAAATWVPGKYGTALDFDGVNDFATYDDTGAIALDIAGSFTVQAWVRFDSLSTSFQTIVYKSAGNTSANYTLMTSASATDLECGFWNGSQGLHNTSSLGLSTNTWYHATCVHDASADTMAIYLNGVFISQSTGVTATPPTSNNDLYIGEETTGFGANPLNGQIDEVKIYNYARSAAQIAYDYNQGEAVAWYKFDDCTGTSITNNAKNSNGLAAGSNGTWSGASGSNTSAGTCSSGNGNEAWDNGTIGKRNASLDFDGTDDVVTVTNANLIDLNNTFANGFTWAAWIYPHSDGENDQGQIFQKNTNTYCLTESESGGFVSLECRLDLATDAAFNPSTTIPINQWSHIALSWTNDADDEITVWINGVAHTSSGAYSGDTATDTANLTIGGGTNNFDGQIDDFRMFQYELSAAQIRKVMNEGSVRFGPDVGSP